MWLIKNNIFQEDEFPFFNLVTTRSCGNLRDPETRKKFCSVFNIDYNSLVTAEQVHGDKVVIVNDSHKGQQVSGVDGLISDTEGLALAVFTADCMPVFLGAEKNRIAGILHAGWRGLANGIIIKAVKIFEKSFNIKPDEISITIGPHIQKCCYSAGDELRKAFGLDIGEANISLSSIAVKQLKELGIKKISLNNQCTFHENDTFFSYRRERTESRMMSLIQI